MKYLAAIVIISNVPNVAFHQLCTGLEKIINISLFFLVENSIRNASILKKTHRIWSNSFESYDTKDKHTDTLWFQT